MMSVRLTSLHEYLLHTVSYDFRVSGSRSFERQVGTGRSRTRYPYNDDQFGGTRGLELYVTDVKRL